jgi:hypothetical protein
MNKPFKKSRYLSREINLDHLVKPADLPKGLGRVHLAGSVVQLASDRYVIVWKGVQTFRPMEMLGFVGVCKSLDEDSIEKGQFFIGIASKQAICDAPKPQDAYIDAAVNFCVPPKGNIPPIQGAVNKLSDGKFLSALPTPI